MRGRCSSRRSDLDQARLHQVAGGTHRVEPDHAKTLAQGLAGDAAAHFSETDDAEARARAVMHGAAAYPLPMKQG